MIKVLLSLTQRLISTALPGIVGLLLIPFGTTSQVIDFGSFIILSAVTPIYEQGHSLRVLAFPNAKFNDVNLFSRLTLTIFVVGVWCLIAHFNFFTVGVAALLNIISVQVTNNSIQRSGTIGDVEQVTKKTFFYSSIRYSLALFSFFSFDLDMYWAVTLGSFAAAIFALFGNTKYIDLLAGLRSKCIVSDPSLLLLTLATAFNSQFDKFITYRTFDGKILESFVVHIYSVAFLSVLSGFYANYVVKSYRSATYTMPKLPFEKLVFLSVATILSLFALRVNGHPLFYVFLSISGWLLNLLAVRPFLELILSQKFADALKCQMLIGVASVFVAYCFSFLYPDGIYYLYWIFNAINLIILSVFTTNRRPQKR